MNRSQLRSKLAAFVDLDQTHKSIEAGWLARNLLEHWRPRKPSEPLILLRRPDTSDIDWAAVHGKLIVAQKELAAYGVETDIEFEEFTIYVYVADAGTQLTLGAPHA
jgi:hypothetical protein